MVESGNEAATDSDWFESSTGSKPKNKELRHWSYPYLEQFVKKHGAQGADLLRRQLDQGVPVEILESSKLEALNTLEISLGIDSPAMRRLLDLESKGLDLEETSRIIELGPDSARMLKENVLAGAAPEDLKINIISPLAHLKTALASDPQVFERVKDLGTKGLDLFGIGEFIRGEDMLEYYYDVKDSHFTVDSKRLEFLEKQLALDPTVEKIFAVRLLALYELTNSLGEHSPVLEKLLAAEQKGLLLSNVDTMEAESEDAGIELRPETISNVIPATTDISSLTASDFIAVQKFQDAFGSTAVSIPRILKLKSEGLRISSLVDYAREKPDTRIPEVMSLLSSEAPASALQPQRLASKSRLEDLFGKTSPIMTKLLEIEPTEQNTFWLRSGPPCKANNTDL